MQRIGEFDIFKQGRPMLSAAERANLQKAKLQQQKEAGYQQLAELCILGEYDAARQLANQNPSWGYEIVGGEVMEREIEIT
jgi:hypothetical protein